MLVKRQNLESVLAEFEKPGEYGLDTETYGLHPHNGDRLFSIILSNENGAYYFNFKSYDDCPSDCFLQRSDLALFQLAFTNPQSDWYIHNAKFDMAMLKNEGLELNGKIYCTEVLSRLVDNTLLNYKLNYVGPHFLNEAKDDTVEKYISKHKLYTIVEVPGKKKKEKNKHFDQVPFGIIVPYGMF
jgi:ribonuclease D